MFLYNQQVTDSLTESFIKLANENGIPVVGVYETMPTPGYDLPVLDARRGQRPEQGRDQQGLDGTPVMTGQAEQELLRLEGIGVRLGGREILRDVSFTVRAGEFTGLIGPNGAGKTTLLKVILGLQAPTSGRVLLNGGPRPRRGGGRLIGYVPQKLSIDPDMPLRARDVVALGIDGNRLGFPLPSAARRDLVDRGAAGGRRRGLRRGPGRRAVRRRAAAGDDRARRHQPAAAAAA